MKKKTFLSTVIIMLIVLGLYVVDDRFVFYDFKESISEKSISLNNTSKGEVENQLLSFRYDNNHMILDRDVLLSDNDLKLYALNSDEEIVSIGISQAENKINESCSGSFLATLSQEDVDIDSDGKVDNVFITAKTDTLQTQGYNVVRTNFSSKEIPMEVVLSNEKDITIYLNGEPLSNQAVKISSLHGLDENYKTDENGQVLGLKIKDVRSGITVNYKGEDNKYYISSYIVESKVLFTALQFEAMIPLFYCCLLSIVGIIAICIIRSFKFKLA